MLKKTRNHPLLILVMLVVGVTTTAATIIMRAWLMPVIMDWETGLFPADYTVFGMMLAVLALLAVLGFLVGGERREIVGVPAFGFGGLSLVAGVLLAAVATNKLVPILFTLSTLPQGEALKVVLSLAEGVFGILGGVALVLLGLRLFSEGGSRRGIVRLWMLAPVLWMWFRLVNYEMSHASLVRLEDSFFGLLMLIMEMLFLFKLARYVAGVGRVSTGSMLFYSLSAALFSISGPVVRMIAYLSNDGAAYNASLATAADFGIGLLALMVAWTTAISAERLQSSESAEVSFTADPNVLVSPSDEEEEE